MMDYELTEECYDILLKDFNEWSEMYYQLFGIDGISGKDINVMLKLGRGISSIKSCKTQF